MGGSWSGRRFLTNWSAGELAALPVQLFVLAIMAAGPGILLYGLGYAIYEKLT